MGSSHSLCPEPLRSQTNEDSKWWRPLCAGPGFCWVHLDSFLHWNREESPGWKMMSHGLSLLVYLPLRKLGLGVGLCLIQTQMNPSLGSEACPKCIFPGLTLALLFFSRASWKTRFSRCSHKHALLCKKHWVKCSGLVEFRHPAPSFLGVGKGQRAGEQLLSSSELKTSTG